jgi:hypothetical protein
MKAQYTMQALPLVRQKAYTKSRSEITNGPQIIVAENLLFLMSLFPCAGHDRPHFSLTPPTMV